MGIVFLRKILWSFLAVVSVVVEGGHFLREDAMYPRSSGDLCRRDSCSTGFQPGGDFLFSHSRFPARKK